MSKNNKLKKLTNFIKNNYTAKQGTVEWHNLRGLNIGGSEMAVITGENPYSKIQDLVANKVGFTTFNPILACSWGTIFETNTAMLVKILFNMDKIYETGSLNGAVPYQRYSPDGLGVIKTIYELENEQLNSPIQYHTEYSIVLFEFKSPYSSIPTGNIPKHYIPQVKTGLCSIPIADYAIFINNVFRKCSISNLDSSPSYDTEFYSKDKLKAVEVLAIGINVFYQNDSQKIKFYDLYSNKINKNLNIDDEQEIQKLSVDNLYNDIYHNKIVDYGSANYYYFKEILDLYSNGLLSVSHFEPFIFENYYENEFINAQNLVYNNTLKYDKYIEKVNKRIASGCVGYIPWKLFMSDIIIQNRDDNYVELYKDKILEVINIIKDIMDSVDYNEKVSKYINYFPKNKLFKNCSEFL